MNWEWEKIKSLHDGLNLDKTSNRLIVSKDDGDKKNDKNSNNNCKNKYYQFLTNIFSSNQNIIKNYYFKKSLFEKIKGFYEINSIIPLYRGSGYNAYTLTQRARPKTCFARQYPLKWKSKIPKDPEVLAELHKYYTQFCQEDVEFRTLASFGDGEGIATDLDDPKSMMYLLICTH